MKKLLYSSVVLLLFSTSILLFQISCQKDAEAKNENTIVTQSKFLYAVNNNLTSTWQYWTANIDGSNHQPIAITLPFNQKLTGSCKLTSDAQKIIFCALGSNRTYYIYSVSTIGGNVTLLKELIADQVEINGVY